VGTGSGLLEIRCLQEEENKEQEAAAYAGCSDLTGESFSDPRT